MICHLIICGYKKNRVVGAAKMDGGYHPFALFKMDKGIVIPGKKILKPEVIGLKVKVKYSEVDINLQAVDPFLVGEMDEADDIEELDLTIYKAWLRKHNLPIPTPIDEEVFMDTLKSEKNKSYFTLARGMIR